MSRLWSAEALSLARELGHDVMIENSDLLLFLRNVKAGYAEWYTEYQGAMKAGEKSELYKTAWQLPNHSAACVNKGCLKSSESNRQI